ncbi:MAG: alpha-2-macroglobulin [Bacteroidota bacterium]
MYHRLSIFAIFLALFISCSKKNEVSIVSTNFEEEVQLVQNLVFSFNKEIVNTADLNSWESTKYIEFTPAIEGKFKWISKNEVVFSPAKSLLPATKYVAKISPKILQKVRDKTLSYNNEGWEFHTPYLKLIKKEAFWAKTKSSAKPSLALKLTFNYPINSAELAKNLKLTEKGNNINYFLGNSPMGNESVFRINTEKTGSTNLDLILEKGLKVSNSSYQTEEPIEENVEVPDAKNLEIIAIEKGFEQNEGFVKVITNHQIKDQNFVELLSIKAQTVENNEIPETIFVQDSLGEEKEIPNPNYIKKESQPLSFRTELTDNGFIVRGNFNETDNYIFSVKKELIGVLNSSLSDDYIADLYFGTMPAHLSFVNKNAVYLSAKGNRNVAVNIVNIPKVNVKISKIYENNILQFLRSNRYKDYNYDGDEDEQSGSYTYYEDAEGNLSDIVVSKTIETENLPKVNGISALNLSIPNQDAIKGVYVVNLNSNDDYYLNTTKLVSISDIGIISKQSDNEVVIFANSLKTAEPMGGVEVKLISSNNQIIQTIKTDSKGIAHFKEVKKLGFKPAMVTTNTIDDFNYLLFEDAKIETSRYDVEGARSSTNGYEAFLYGDRNIYRPGETVYFNTIIRNESWKSVGEIPIKVRFLMPNGKEYQSFKLTTNSEGAVEQKIPIDVSAVTGTYRLEVLNANDVLLTSQPISIEEFMPDRIKVQLSSPKDIFRSGEVVQISAQATNLFGPPATDRNYEMQLDLTRKQFRPKAYKGYTFDIEDHTKFEQVLREGKTDAHGIATQAFEISKKYADMGILEGKAFVTVFDETGRPVNRLKTFEVHTQPVLFGIGTLDNFVDTNIPVQIPLLAITPSESTVNTKAWVEIIRYEYQTVIEKNRDNSVKYSSKKLSKIVYSREVSFINGKATISYAPNISGDYRVRIGRKGSQSYTSQSFYAYQYGSTESSSFEVNNEGQVTMEFDKEKYEVGDKATVLFKTPFAGKLLVTVERNKVFENFFIETDKKSAELSFKIREEHLPNIYVSATLIRPMDGSSIPLTVAHGYGSINVESADNQLPIEIVAVQKSRSKTHQKITVKTKANTEVTIAVVDEGILQVKNYKSPDPYHFFFQKKALEVSSADLYPFLFPELSMSGRSSTGGDGYNLEKRINPLSNGRVKLIALWSGIKKTGFSGETSFEFEVPQFSGDLRIMAVAYKGDAFGAANKSMKVADPLVISTALPRFVSPNDLIEVPVNITNTTKQPTNASATINLTGNLALIGSKTQNVQIGSEKEGRVIFTVRAKNGIGAGSVVVKVNGLKETFVEKTEITVRPLTSLLKTASSGIVVGGKSININLENKDFVPNTISSSLLVSRSPMVQFTNNFQSLLEYPYGCLEQTVSSAFPQLYFSDFVKQIKSGKKPLMKAGDSDLNPNTNVQAAIRKVESLQLVNGGLSTWQAGDSENWWATAYAAHFLQEAQKADFEVNSAVFTKILDYLTLKTNNQATELDYKRNRDGSYSNKMIAKREAIYSLYSLALAGKPNRPMMNYYKSNLALLSIDEKYLLAGAFNHIGDNQSFKSILPSKFLIENDERQSGGSYSSPIRNMAMVLNTLLETDSNNLQIPTLANQLSMVVKNKGWLNTQEQAFLFLSFGKLAKQANKATVTATIFANKKVIGKFDGNDLMLKSGLGSQLIINSLGTGNLYYFAQSEGLSDTGKVTEIDNGLVIRKSFFNRAGQPVSPSEFTQNQLVVVKIVLSSANSLPIQNIVITDMLPAGLEIENPRISPERELIWVKDQSQPEHFDLRDDRINYFTSIEKDPKTFYYLARAVSKGTFNMGPVSADAMYNGELRSYSGSGVCVVR